MASVKRVLILTHSFPRRNYPDYGMIAYNVATRLGLLGLDVLILTRRLAEPKWAVNAPLQVREIAYPDSNLQRLPPGIVPKLFGFTQSIVGQMILAAKAVAPARAFQPDVVHSFGALTLPAALTVRAFMGVPVVVSLEGTDFQRIRRSPLLTRWLGLADAVICVSKDMYSDLTKRLPNKSIYYCPPGVDLSVFSPGSADERRPRLISVGRLDRVKRHDRLLQAAAIVFRRRPDLSLTIMGRGPLRESLGKLASALGIEDKVQFGGIVGKQELAELLRMSQLFVLSSDWEGTPKALLEALASGTPAVVTDVGECARLVQGAGRVAVDPSPEAIADAILSLLGSDMWESCSRQAVANAMLYSWPQVVKRVHEAYLTLLTERRMNVDAQQRPGRHL